MGKRRNVKLSDTDKQLIADGLKEISGLIRERPEVLGLALGVSAQAYMTYVEQENEKRGWKYDREENRWITKQTGHSYTEWFRNQNVKGGGPPLPPSQGPILAHHLIGKQQMELLRNYGLVSPLLHSVESQWAEAGIIASIGIQPWSDQIIDKLGDGVKDTAEFLRPADYVDWQLAGLGGLPYLIGKFIRR